MSLDERLLNNEQIIIPFPEKIIKLRLTVLALIITCFIFDRASMVLLHGNGILGLTIGSDRYPCQDSFLSLLQFFKSQNPISSIHKKSEKLSLEIHGSIKSWKETLRRVI